MQAVARAVELLTADERATAAVSEVLDAAGMTAFVIGVDTPVRWIAPSWETIYGGSCEDFGRRRSELLRLVHPGEADAVAALLDEASAPGLLDEASAPGLLDEASAPGRRTALRRDVRLRLADGSYRRTEVALHLLRAASGSRVVFGLLSDATHRHDRGAAGTDPATAEFVSKMSHELRTPLHAILGYAQLLEMGAGDPAEHLRRVRRAGDHLVHLLDDLLDVSRLGAGRLTVADEPVELWPVLETAVDLVAATASTFGVGIDLVAGDAAAVRGDATRLQQVLTNLLTNAVKYNRPGGQVRMHFSVRADAVDVVIADTGQGIAPELFERLFVPFDRLGAELGEVPGAGLGLPVANGLVDAMGGRLDITSVPGVGTTARVTLRRAG
jgi:signal transduction histidine kinase